MLSIAVRRTYTVIRQDYRRDTSFQHLWQRLLCLKETRNLSRSQCVNLLDIAGHPKLVLCENNQALRVRPHDVSKKEQRSVNSIMHTTRWDATINEGKMTSSSKTELVKKEGSKLSNDKFLRVHLWHKLKHLHCFFLDQRLKKLQNILTPFTNVLETKAEVSSRFSLPYNPYPAQNKFDRVLHDRKLQDVCSSIRWCTCSCGSNFFSSTICSRTSDAFIIFSTTRCCTRSRGTHVVVSTISSAYPPVAPTSVAALVQNLDSFCPKLRHWRGLVDRLFHSLLWDQLHLDCLFRNLRHCRTLDGRPLYSFQWEQLPHLLHDFNDVLHVLKHRDIHVLLLLERSLHDALLDLQHWQSHSLLHVTSAVHLQRKLHDGERQGLLQTPGQTRHRNVVKNANETNCIQCLIQMWSHLDSSRQWISRIYRADVTRKYPEHVPDVVHTHCVLLRLTYEDPSGANTHDCSTLPWQTLLTQEVVSISSRMDLNDVGMHLGLCTSSRWSPTPCLRCLVRPQSFRLVPCLFVSTINRAAWWVALHSPDNSVPPQDYSLTVFSCFELSSTYP